MLTKGTHCHTISAQGRKVVFDRYDFSPEKDKLLKRERGLGFEDVIALIEGGQAFLATRNSNPKYPHQFIFEVEIGGYIHIVPFVVDGTCAYLKTVYPSRKATKRRRRKNGKEKLDERRR